MHFDFLVSRNAPDVTDAIQMFVGRCKCFPMLTFRVGAWQIC